MKIMEHIEKVEFQRDFGFLCDEEFEKLVTLGPLISIDLIVENQKQELG